LAGFHASLLLRAVTAAGSKLCNEATAFSPDSPLLLSLAICPLPRLLYFYFYLLPILLRRFIPLREPTLLSPLPPLTGL
jgi:hypothetical protein